MLSFLRKNSLRSADCMNPKQRMALIHFLKGKSVPIAEGLEYFGIADEPSTAAIDIANEVFRCPSCHTWKIAVLEQEDGRCGVCATSSE